jgi:RecB family exonuclease
MHHARCGAAFHRLVQQHLIGIGPERLSAAAAEADVVEADVVEADVAKSNVAEASVAEASVVEANVAEWWDAYLRNPPSDIPPDHRVELSLRVPVDAYALVARYDLVAVDPGRRAVIVDWKTTQSRPSRAQLAARMQTLVYRYVLAEASAQVNDGQPLAPEQVELVYWFAGHPQQTERFAYGASAHGAAGQRLQSLVSEIASVERGRWPLTSDQNSCRRCPYQTLCGREGRVVGLEIPEDEVSGESLDLDLEQIAEIEF